MTKLPPVEARDYFRPKWVPVDLRPYHDALRALRPGEVVTITDYQPATVRQIKRRFGHAASDLNYHLKWARDRADGTLAFELRGGGPNRRKRVYTPKKRAA